MGEDQTRGNPPTGVDPAAAVSDALTAAKTIEGSASCGRLFCAPRGYDHGDLRLPVAWQARLCFWLRTSKGFPVSLYIEMLFMMLARVDGTSSSVTWQKL